MEDCYLQNAQDLMFGGIDGRPLVANEMDQLQAVHGTGHMDIKRYNVDVGPSLQNGNRLIRVSRLDHFEASILSHLDSVHKQKWFVFNHKHD